MSVLSKEDLEEIVTGVWMTMLDLCVEASEASDFDQLDHLTASIRISGAWDGRVQLRTSRQFLTLAAQKVFAKAANDIDSQDHVDILEELTNMIGGTVKSLLPEVCDLSLPEMIEAQIAKAVDINNSPAWAHFTSEGHALAVAVCEGAVKTKVAA